MSIMKVATFVNVISVILKALAMVVQTNTALKETVPAHVSILMNVILEFTR